MIATILFYGSEVWGFHKAPDIEKVHMKFLKQLLGVRIQTPNAAVFGEFGRFPFEIIRKVRLIKYWYRALKSPDSLIYKCMFATDDNDRLINSWTIKLKTMLSDLGFAYLWNLRNISVYHIKSVIQRIYDHYLQSWCSDVSTFSKLESYRIYKLDFRSENYLNCVNNTKYRNSLSRFRCSAHKLAIEEGRFRNIPRESRLCNKCSYNQIENEYHFLLICPFYRELRKQFIPRYYFSWPNMNKFKDLMQTSNKKHINNLAKFVHLAMDTRNNVIN
jgi:hypothetical protein